MASPFKRPRISFFEEEVSGAEFVSARYNNDMILKNRFESIFTKYTQDFTGIGDEIDLVNECIVVNNGHIENMETETDLGIDNVSGGFTSAGKSMLRAMTVTLNPDLPGPDDVLMSIETIAENATFTAGEDEYNVSETRTSSTSRSKSVVSNGSQDHQGNGLLPYDSDSDSLFNGSRVRSASVDSLFGKRSFDHAFPDDRVSQQSIETPSSLEPSHQDEDSDILARFGPSVGKEVLRLIGQRKDEHVEPAWRIPVNIKATSAWRPISGAVISSPVESNPEGKQNQSLWKIPRSSYRNATKERTADNAARDGSVDPLQEDFLSDPDHTRFQSLVSNDPEDSDTESVPEGQLTQELIIQASAAGSCPYCDLHFGNHKSGVMAHWDRLLRHAPTQSKENDPHDYAMMRKIRSTARSRVRLPRLVVYDFRTIVELHEGAGLTFDEIVTSKTLRTRKTALQVQDIYHKHRSPPSWEESTTPASAWTEVENELLMKMCTNPLATMTTLRRGLKGRNEVEIGNHLAEIWLSQLGSGRRTSEEDGLQGQKSVLYASIAEKAPKAPGRPDHGSQAALNHIKQEESEDELFAKC